MKGAFITATGTGVGKTWLAAALASACVQRGKHVAAIKPIETGVDPDPLDALALAHACGDASLANAAGLYRAKEPLAPYAIEKRGGPSIGSLSALAKRVRELSSDADYAIVEGAGGVLVPLDREHTIADFAALLDLQTVLVARNALGVLSYTLTAVEALRKEDFGRCNRAQPRGSKRQRRPQSQLECGRARGLHPAHSDPACATGAEPRRPDRHGFTAPQRVENIRFLLFRKGIHRDTFFRTFLIPSARSARRKPLSFPSASRAWRLSQTRSRCLPALRSQDRRRRTSTQSRSSLPCTARRLH